MTTAMLCDIESLFLSSTEALEVWLADGDTLSKGRRTTGSDVLGLLIHPSSAADTPVRADQLEPFFNAIRRNLACPRSDPKIFGEFGAGEINVVLDSREGRPPSCVEPIVPTKAEHFDRADLLVHIRPAAFGASFENALEFFPRNIPGNPAAELTVQACCAARGDPPEGPPSTALDPIPEETNRAFEDLGRLLGAPGVPPPPTPYAGSAGVPGVGQGNLNAQTEVKQDKALHKEFIKMLRELVLSVTTAFNNIFGASVGGAPLNEQEVIVATVTVEGPFPWVAVTGDLMDDGTFLAEGRGTVAGFPDIAVEFDGTLTPGGVVGDYTMGAEGGLPQGEPIIYSVEGRLEDWDTFFDELSGVFLEAGEAAAGLYFDAPLGGADWGAAMRSITGELLRAEAGLLYLDAEGTETMPGDGLRGVESALTDLADAVADSTWISREQTETNLRQAGAQFGAAAGLMDRISTLARTAPTGTASDDIQQFLDSLRATAPLLDAVRISALGNPFTTVSAADFTGPVAPGSIVSGFGETGAAFEIAQEVPLPTTLGGVSVRVTDSEGEDRAGSFFFSSSGQLNFLIPESAAVGDAVITAFAGNQVLASGSVRIEPVAPTLFAANADGKGVAAARYLRVPAEGDRVEDFIFDTKQVPRTATPIDLSGEGEQVFLLLFGTGIRGFSDEVTATVNGVAVRVLGAVKHGVFEGLDQVNIGPIPDDLIGAGEVDIVIRADGVPANAVTVNFQ